MKRNPVPIFLVLFLTWVSSLQAQSSVKPQTSPDKSTEKKPGATVRVFGFIDKNGDGINDVFRDADGDGRNDVDGKAYPHAFEFKDKNRDKINDLWVDRDGDGVNDLSSKLKGKARREGRRNVLDIDGDGRNDITGEPFDRAKHRWMGERWGFWDEQKGKLRGKFIDENGDGIDDRLMGGAGFGHRRMHGSGMRDVFIDEDGDGFSDGRSDVIQRMGRCGRGDGRQGRVHGGRHH